MGVTSQSYLRAGFSVLLGMLVLGERISPAIGIGLTAIILGVAAIHYRGRKAV
jgi:drug/metabolite transporter (DMT)-like permease